jgi:restriction system protein
LATEGKLKMSDYMLPTLKILSDGEKHSRQEIAQRLSSESGLLKCETPRGGSFIVLNGILGYFIKAKAIELVEPKVFVITKRGLKLLKENKERLDVQSLKQFPEFVEFFASRYKKNAEPMDPEKLPEEYMDSSYLIHRQTLIEEIRERLADSSWQFFETVVKDIVIAIGYGSKHEEPSLSTGPGDEGIDGIIKQDELGLDIVCLQATRWTKPVGRPDVQKFAGSLDGIGARKGIFITTSQFTKEARSYCGG